MVWVKGLHTTCLAALASSTTSWLGHYLGRWTGRSGGPRMGAGGLHTVPCGGPHQSVCPHSQARSIMLEGTVGVGAQCACTHATHGWPHALAYHPYTGYIPGIYISQSRASPRDGYGARPWGRPPESARSRPRWGRQQLMMRESRWTHLAPGARCRSQWRRPCARVRVCRRGRTCAMTCFSDLGMK